MTIAETTQAATLLKALVHERRLTVSEALDVLQARATRMGETSYALSERQLRRWMSGDVASAARARPANVRVVEAEFDWPIDTLLAADDRTAELATTASADAAEPLRCEDLVRWVDEHSDISRTDASIALAASAGRIAKRPGSPRTGRQSPRLDRVRVADALAGHYGDDTGFHRTSIGGQHVDLSILTEPSWTGLSVPLGGDAEHFTLDPQRGPRPVHLDRKQAEAALGRLAEVEATDTVVVNNPLYDLNAVEFSADRITACVGTTDFAAYALTSDLLEQELLDQIASGTDPRRMATPLRRAWLPTLDAALDIGSRLCAGGPVCLLAIADGDHYRLLIQERSARVLNATGTLSVIPKAFHQPVHDTFGDTPLSSTIERELEEELFGRPDLDQLAGEAHRRVAPLHPEAASAPMRWLHNHRDAWRVECTGFGINLVSGNYEFACLVVVHDPEWWQRFGHLLQANWEADRMHCLWSSDGDGITHLVADPRWSNEGLFAFTEGLRRLAAIDPAKVAVAPGCGR